MKKIIIYVKKTADIRKENNVHNETKNGFGRTVPEWEGTMSKLRMPKIPEEATKLIGEYIDTLTYRIAELESALANTDGSMTEYIKRVLDGTWPKPDEKDARIAELESMVDKACVDCVRKRPEPFTLYLYVTREWLSEPL